jgi:hypothetical protein
MNILCRIATEASIIQSTTSITVSITSSTALSIKEIPSTATLRIAKVTCQTEQSWRPDAVYVSVPTAERNC